MASGTPASNIREFSVSELSFALKRMVEDNFEYVRVRGEISGFKRAASGHLYMKLKDDQSVLDAVCWRGVSDKLKIRPEDGLEVIVTGKLTTYPGRSNYQIVIQSMEAAGVGALMALLEERRKKLTAEGLFDSDRKRVIPYLPRVIGVVTSPTGAVIRDILHRLADRFPRHVLVWPVLVQGEAAAGQIATAIRGFNAISAGGGVSRPDVLIVARGGGSLEDLWAFNEEIVVRAAAESDIPLISAVGHETDTTLIDYASDLRAPTPTAAAEMAVPVQSELAFTVSNLNRRLDQAKSRYLRLLVDRLRGLARALPSASDLLALPGQRFDALTERLPRALTANVQAHKARLEKASTRLLLLGPGQQIERKRGSLADLDNRLVRVVHQGMLDRGRRVDTLSRLLKPTAVGRDIGRQGERLVSLGQRLGQSFSRHVRGIEVDFSARSRLLESFSYRKTLERGYAVVRTDSGGLIMRAAETASGATVDVEFHDGHVGMMITAPGSRLKRDVKKSSPKGGSTKQETDEKQGTLL